MNKANFTLGWLAGRLVAGQRGIKRQTVPVHSGVIPLGGRYLIGATSTIVGDYSGAATTLTQGQPFPEAPADGDIYLYDDYEYRYNKTLVSYTDPAERTWTSTTQNCWCVAAVDRTKAVYAPAISAICGINVVGMNYCYGGCTGMTVMPEIPASIRQANGAFMGCTGLTEVVYPNTVTNADEIFKNCTGLRKATIPADIKVSKLYRPFSSCSALTEIVMPERFDTVTIINNLCHYLTSLTEITFPAGITDMGSYPIFSCPALTTVRMLEPTPPTARSGLRYSSTALTQIIVPAGSAEAYKTANIWKTCASMIVEAAE